MEMYTFWLHFTEITYFFGDTLMYTFWLHFTEIIYCFGDTLIEIYTFWLHFSDTRDLLP